MFGRATITLGIGPHSSCQLITLTTCLLAVLTSEANPRPDVRLSDIALVEALVAVKRDVKCSASLCSPADSCIISTHPPSTRPYGSVATSPFSIFHLKHTWSD